MSKKLTLLIIICFIVISSQICFAKKSNEDTKLNNTNYTSEDSYDLEDNSYDVSNQQSEDLKNLNEIEEKTSFWDKIIDSGYFSSNTATRTYRPINKED